MKSILIILGVLIGVIGLIFLALYIAAYRRRPKFNNKGFTELEKRLLIELYGLFDSETQTKLKAQVEYFEPKRKWRQYWEKSMAIELYGDNKNPLSDSLRYIRKDESKLATIRFKVDDDNYYVEFNNYDGRIWGWKIRPNPKSIIKTSAIKVTSKKINNDPNTFAQTSFKKKKMKSVPKFEGLLKELDNINSINKAFDPIGKKYLKNYTNRIDSKLPAEYLQIVEKSEGVDFGYFRILGASEIYTTGLDDGNYYHLAEFDDGVITIKEEDKSGTIFYCYYSGLLDNLGTDFKKVILDSAKSKTPQHNL
jgi:hypothetical protein